ncbi:hypothetical protein HK405_006546 [Cladochytrium tenue]|nr:hypothetical protein HK405_006546 [Cladochytrium tenue]
MTRRFRAAKVLRECAGGGPSGGGDSAAFGPARALRGWERELLAVVMGEPMHGRVDAPAASASAAARVAIAAADIRAPGVDAVCADALFELRGGE